MAKFVEKGSIKYLSAILKNEQSKKVLIFRGKSSYETIKSVIEEQLEGVEFEYFKEFSTNPKYEEIQSAINTIKNDFDIIAAIGGGSVIDFAKAFRHYTKPLKLIAIPTTCGTGSEVTQFAVVYKDGVKISLDDKSILPEYAIVDSEFVENNPKYLKACTAMDAYCQAIESYWAVNSTDESREFAQKSIELCRDYIIEYVNTNNSMASEKMALASHFSGKAINISRTTASHALSYKITSDYKIPHGHAVSLTIGRLMELNSRVNEENCNDKRGLNFVREKIDDLKRLISYDFISYINSLMNEIGLGYNLTRLGINNISTIVQSVNIERLNNNPVILEEKDLIYLLNGDFNGINS